MTTRRKTDDGPRRIAIDAVTGEPLDLSRMHPSYVRWFEQQQVAKAEQERADAEREAKARNDAIEAWFREHVDPLLNATCHEQDDRRLQRWAERVFGERGADRGR